MWHRTRLQGWQDSSRTMEGESGTCGVQLQMQGWTTFPPSTSQLVLHYAHVACRYSHWAPYNMAGSRCSSPVVKRPQWWTTVEWSGKSPAAPTRPKVHDHKRAHVTCCRRTFWFSCAFTSASRAAEALQSAWHSAYADAWRYGCALHLPLLLRCPGSGSVAHPRLRLGDAAAVMRRAATLQSPSSHSAAAPLAAFQADNWACRAAGILHAPCPQLRHCAFGRHPPPICAAAALRHH